MLVKETIPAESDDRGSTLVVVLVIMLVLSIGALTAGTIVSGTTASLVGSRGALEARAAADAGLADAVAHARRTATVCDVTLTNSTAPRYETTSTCADGLVTFTATGWGDADRAARLEAVFEYSSENIGGEGDMVFFGEKTTFTGEVLAHTLDDDLLSIVIPTGDFTCQSVIPANIVLSGSFATKGGCDVHGSVVAGGTIDMAVGGDMIRGNLSVAGAGSNIIRGTIGGDILAGGSLLFGTQGNSVGGDVTAEGDVYLGNQSLLGSLTLPAGAIFSPQEGSVAGDINTPESVSTPAEAPTFDPWFDYEYEQSHWPDYDVITLENDNSSSASGTCKHFNAHPGTGWTSLESLTTPTILDARACTTLSTNNGSEPDLDLKTDVVLLGNDFNLTALTIGAAAGADPHLWFVVEDTVADGVPTCTNGNDILINGTVIQAGVTAMAYTPCIIDVAGMNNDLWHGGFYGGSFDYGGGLSFYGVQILLPDMPEGATSVGAETLEALGTLVSQRDVAR
ncbi:hypothetical protein M4I32_10020 [Microbacterium sp. LRZ72]|uniref:hypothetical protein n=1 Tax=Microbacterium sp. LRZ72 TaxID=2942481 RepID=UPI0029B22965|nr:hypothetical protein [Microbacterium sp. LRZ72]MDX2377134.1 hypothetical protein [Microbacterium sp. LRZ72]